MPVAIDCDLAYLDGQFGFPDYIIDASFREALATARVPSFDPENDTPLAVREIIRRAIDIYTPVKRDVFLEIVRMALRQPSRRMTLAVVSWTGPLIRAVAGTEAIHECIAAVDDQRQWWP